MLVCNAGMSTGMLAKRIEEESENIQVVAYGEAEYLDYLEGVSLILVGPQIRHLISEIKKEVTIPVYSIAPQHYGVMNGKGVFEDIKKILKQEGNEYEL